MTHNDFTPIQLYKLNSSSHQAPLDIYIEWRDEMITISLCMIVKNEEAVIGRCLDSVKNIVDEINIIDTGSTDKTKEIVAKYTNRIFDFTWIDDFAAARNFSFQQATKQYILWLDADDLLTRGDQQKLISLKETLSTEVDAVSMKYHLSFDEDGNVTWSLSRYRLVKKSCKFQWVGAVHEFLDISGHFYESDVAISHLPLAHDRKRNLGIYEKRLKSGKKLSTRDIFYYANELTDHQQYKKAIKYYERFLATNLGWIEDNIRACFKIADCYAQLNEPKKQIAATLRTLTYDVPRPEICCRMGYYFMQSHKNAEAIHWYKLALVYKNDHSSSLQDTSYLTWLPHLQLAVLYDRIQQFEKGASHNDAALQYKPTDPIMLENKSYFDEVLQRTPDE